MKVTVNQQIKKLKQNPKKLFLIDGFGAILSSFLLGVVLVRFETFFGIPIPSLYFLALVPLLFVAYDFYSYRSNTNTSNSLKRIAIANFLYCCISIGFALFHLETITTIGWAYILLEIAIVLVLATVELMVSRVLMQKNNPY